MHAKATTVDDYLAGLPPERREVLETVLGVVRNNVPAGFDEVMAWGMITWQVPLSVVPNTYNGQPLMFAALAAQKSHYALYLMSIHLTPERAAAFEAAYRATGKKYDVGKSCVRFKKLDQLPLEVIATAIAAVDLPTFAGIMQAGR